jgi:hypothetical protein
LWTNLLFALFLGGTFGLMLLAANSQGAVRTVVAVIAFLNVVGSFAGIVALQSTGVRAKLITDGEVTLCGLHPKFVDACQTLFRETKSPLQLWEDADRAYEEKRRTRPRVDG